jgi:serine phosphatase RsbU (regulator of sigma subunit)
LKNKISILFFLLISSIVRAQENNKKIDSLETLVALTTNENQQFILYEDLFRKTVNYNKLKAKLYLKELETLDKKINTQSTHAKLEFLKIVQLAATNDNELVNTKLEKVIVEFKMLNLKDELAEAYGAIGEQNSKKGNFIQALEQLTKSDSLAVENNNIRLQCENAMLIGRCYEQIGNKPKAIKNLRRSLELSEQLKNMHLRAQALLIIGSVYSEESSQEFSLKYLNEAAQIATEERDTNLLINVYTYIANSHYYEKQYNEALKIYESIKILCLRQNNKHVYAGTIGNMGNVYADMGEKQKGLDYQLEAVKLFEEQGDKEGMTICYSSIGASYNDLENYSKALEYYNKGLALAEEMKTAEDLIEIHYGMSRAYEALGDYKKAYENFKVYKQYNDSIFSEGNTKKLTELELNYQFENKQKEISLQRELEKERFKRWIYVAVAGILLLLAVVTIVYRNNRQRKKTNEQLQLFNTEIVEQKEELQQKNTIIEIAYNDIKSSINYAKRIQEAILPIKDEIKRSFPESFVLFKPRDVVSGDFYWFTKHNHKNIIACVDCTGHGVPGAFMSMIGNTLLNEIVNEKEIEKPSDILNLLHERVRQSLKQNLESTETRDGMDIALCVIDIVNNTLEYAGANRPLYLIRDNNLNEIKADKMSIGGDKMEEDRSFTNHQLEIKKKDIIYMSSDGYADQFGGEKGKKFMVKRFHQTLLEINHLSMEQQGSTLKKIIEQWQGNSEQIDDILVMGIKI